MAAFIGDAICISVIGSEKTTYSRLLYLKEKHLNTPSPNTTTTQNNNKKNASQIAKIILYAVLFLSVTLLWATQVYTLFISVVNGGVTYVEVVATTEPLKIHM